MLKYTATALIIGYLLDLIIGDPRWLYHPVRLIGLLISEGEKVLRKIMPDTELGLKFAGVMLVVLVVALSGIVPMTLLMVAFSIHKALGVALMSFMCYQLLATKSLKVESMRVYSSLKDGTIEDGRHAVSMIVGRDTESLDTEGVIKATVETVAENFSDGVFAPMFYMMIGGPVLMFMYKAINTMDSMIGYKNGRYIYFGRAAAKLDDVVNYIPARLSALALIIVTPLTNMNMKSAWRIWKRDRRNHASPNSAQTESAVAGAMEVQLAGNAYYFGELYEKPTIGDAINSIELENIPQVNRLMYWASAVSAVAFAVIAMSVWRFYG